MHSFGGNKQKAKEYYSEHKLLLILILMDKWRKQNSLNIFFFGH